MNSGSLCALCESNPRSEDSHIIPAFAFRWLKKTSATGHLRKANDPNRRIQDGAKYPLLCEVCEDLLGIDEGEFAKQIFHPYANEKPKRMAYDEHCLRFAVSIVWRVLHHLWVDDAAIGEPLQAEFEGRLKEPYRVWADFLLRRRPHPDEFTVNILPVDDIVEANGGKKPVGLSQYFTGSIDMDLICNTTSGYVYAKIPHFLFFGKIFAHPAPKFSKNTLIRLRKGMLGGTNMQVPPDISHYVLDRAEWMLRTKQGMSERQKEVIRTAVDKDPNRARNSRSFHSAMADLRLDRNS